MMKLKGSRIFILFLIISNNLFAHKIKIKVVDQEDNRALSFVQVYQNQKKFIGFTDEKGYIFYDTDDIPVKLSFVLLGYNTLIKQIEVNEKKEYLFKLTQLSEDLSEVILNYKRKETFGLTTLKPVEGTHIYAGKKSEVILLDQELTNKSTNNARQIFAKVAGLNIYDSNDGGLQLNIGGRGLDPNRTANFNTRQNDYDISADVLGYPESYYTPPSEALSQIQVLRGAASLQYGTQFGGLVNFKFHKPNQTKKVEFITRNTVASFGTLTNFTSLSGTVDKLSYYTFYNGKKGDGFRSNSGYDSTNLFAHIAYKFNNKTNISAEYTHFKYLAQQAGGLSDVQFLENPKLSYRTRNWFKVNWNLFNFKLNHELSKSINFSLSFFALDASRKAVGFRNTNRITNGTLSDNNNLFNVDSDEQEDGVFLAERDLLVGTFKNYGAEARIITKYNIGAQESVLLLGSKFYKANNTSEQGPGSRGTDADFKFRTDEFPEYINQNKFEYPNLNVSVFGENIFNITDHLSVTPGFRFEHISTESKGSYIDVNGLIGQHPQRVFIPDDNKLDRNFMLFGVGISYKPRSFFESYFNFSQNYRSVTFSDIRTTSPSFVIDPNIKDETGYTLDIGIRGRYKSILNYDINVYSLQYDNRIGQRYSTKAPYRDQWVRGNIGQASIYGFESLIQWNLKETFFKENKNISLSVFSNLALTTSEYISSIESNIKGNEVEFVPNVNLKTGLSIGYKNFLSSLQYTYISEQFTDVTNSPYRPENDKRVDGAIPSYNILDLSMSYKLSKNFKLETGINNLLDNSYFTRRATGYPGPGIIPAEPRSYYATLEIKI